MMLTILRTRFLAFIIIYIHSFSFLINIALAAPVPVTTDISSVLQTREHYTGRNVGDKISDGRAPVTPYLRRKTPTKSTYALASTERQDLGLRNVFSKTGDAFKGAGNEIKSRVQKVGNRIKNAAQKVGNAIKKVTQKVGSGIKNAAQKVGNGIKNVAQKVGNGVKHAANVVGKGLKTAGKWVKDNAAKIVKGGLKVLSTVGSVAAKAANFIPGVGKAASQGLKAASFGLDTGSNAIQADLGAFNKVANVMDKIQHPLSGAGGKVLDAILKRDMDEVWVLRRDIFTKECEFY